MAHVVGVPKRDPCAKCSMPVFLAERMAVGTHIYHRTCLKCARCSSQLTLGNFYETEVDGEFCCETCPDEEEKENQSNRSSIADRLAFFESAHIDDKVLSKSMSDEEKSKSLKAAAVPTYKSNAAFSNFVNDTAMDETDNGGDEEIPIPELPSSSPPPLDPTPRTFTSSSSIVVKSNKPSTANDARKSISSEETKDNDSNTKVNGKNPENIASPTLDLETTNRLSLVRARLNQFEEDKSSLVNEEQEAISTDPIIEQVPEIKSEVNENISLTNNNSEVQKEDTDDEIVFVPLDSKDSPQEEANQSVLEENSSKKVVEPEEKVFEPEVPLSINSQEEKSECSKYIPDVSVHDVEVLEKIDLSKIDEKLDTDKFIPEDHSNPIEENLESNKSILVDNSVPIDEKLEFNKHIPDIIVENNEVLEKVEQLNSIIEKEGVLEEIPLTQDNKANEDKEPEVTLEKDNKENYPDYLNPFQSEDEEDSRPKPSTKAVTSTPSANDSLNPFDSSDDEVELDKVKCKPPRPPPPKISKNPFGSESEEDESAMKSSTSKTPIPKPRTSTNPTPEPTPRPSLKQSFNTSTPLNSDVYGSTPSLNRYCDSRGSNNSLTSNTSSAIHSRKSKRAPPPPGPVIKELFPSTETLSSQGSSNSTTPKQGRKKRPAPPPPTSTVSKNLDSCPQQSQLSDEEKALLEGNVNNIEKKPSGRRLIALDLRIINDQDASDDIIKKEEENVVYRRKIIPLDISSPTEDLDFTPSTRQLEKLKDNKESQNRNRQSQLANSNDDNNDSFFNKSSHGKWKRRKGPAPQLPVPPRKILQMLPLQEIRHELDIIEVQQQGLEKQGVVLEKMIRERCEGKDGELEDINGKQQQNTKEVEDLILQLFELVNEKNELFRRQAELMYLRRQHRLEQEQADLEYEIRLLMAQPERNKTDSDKSREESMIARLVEVVQLRNEVIECLEMDRLREAEEDMSIKQQLEIHSAKREIDNDSHSEKESSQIKLSKKEKKKQKESKKLGKSKKVDADKDTDESEVTKEKTDKKKKKKFLFLH